MLATSTYDWDPDLVQELLGLEPEMFGSLAPATVRGDGIRLARGVGAAVARIPPRCVPMVPGWRADDGSVENGPEYAMPHAMIVDRAGSSILQRLLLGRPRSEGARRGRPAPPVLP